MARDHDYLARVAPFRRSADLRGRDPLAGLVRCLNSNLPAETAERLAFHARTRGRAQDVAAGRPSLTVLRALAGASGQEGR